MKFRPRTYRIAQALMGSLLLAALIAGLASAKAVLDPQIDTPDRVDAIVVVAGSIDDRYEHARALAESGVADRIIVSRPSRLSDRFASVIEDFCGLSPLATPNGRQVQIDCFAPDIDTTEGEAAAATRIARERGFDSLLVLTYWGHVSRVRIYFEQCFDGSVYVADTPQPPQISRGYALIYETGGYVKASLRPAC